MTGPSYRLINPQANRSFVFKWEAFDLNTRWHYHPELELIYFMEGRTNSVIGDGFGEFAAGDVVLLGANFPHVLQENPAFKRQNPEERPFGLIIQFTEDFLGETFKNAPEMQPLRGLFQRARRGLHFGEALRAAVKPLLHDMYHQHDTRKLVQLLNVLVTLAESNDFQYLVNQDYFFDFSKDEERMWRINQYVYANFQEPISISQAAEIANMSETAFCRYFKTRTLKTFTRFLNEIRIAYACKLLQKKDSTVTQACFESGFNSLSYFDRTFKEVMGKSPLEHRRMHELRDLF